MWLISDDESSSLVSWRAMYQLNWPMFGPNRLQSKVLLTTRLVHQCSSTLEWHTMKTIFLFFINDSREYCPELYTINILNELCHHQLYYYSNFSIKGYWNWTWTFESIVLTSKYAYGRTRWANKLVQTLPYNFYRHIRVI